MKMHEFIAEHRDEIFNHCVHQLKEETPDRDEHQLGDHLHAFIDNVVAALREGDLGLMTATSGEEALAARVGKERFQDGFPVSAVVRSFANVSIAVGEVGGQHQASFEAEEYARFNRAIDDSVAIAIEQYESRARANEAQATSAQVAFLAHEIRNAVWSAKMAFAMLQRGQVGIQGRTGDIVRRSLARLERLAQEMLLVGRDGPISAPSVRAIALAPLLHELAGSTVLERGITIHVDAQDPSEVVADEQLLISAIGNLLQNGVKFSHDGARVVLRAWNAEPDHVQIEVEDACGGLPPGDPARLFQPFVQGNADTRGAGLGLAIARQSIRAMSGDLAVRDRPGQGCVFSILLPRPGPSSDVGAREDT